MSIKVFLIVVILFVQAVFAGLNIRNASDISLGFTVIKDVPVFMTITVSFVTGVLLAFPLAYFSAKKSKKIKKDTVKINNEVIPDNKIQTGEQEI